VSLRVRLHYPIDPSSTLERPLAATSLDSAGQVLPLASRRYVVSHRGFMLFGSITAEEDTP
jgi:hypothetical protein